MCMRDIDRDDEAERDEERDEEERDRDDEIMLRERGEIEGGERERGR